MHGHAGEVVAVRTPRMNLRDRVAQLWSAVTFLLGRVVFGAWAYILIIAGLMVAAGVAVALGFATVFVLPFVVGAFVGVLLLALVVRLVSEPVREWLSTRPFSRTATRAGVLLARGLAGAASWWLLLCRATARRERARVVDYRGEDIPTAYRPLPDGPVATLRVTTADPTTWRDLLYLVISPAYAALACFVIGFMTAGGIAIIVEALEVNTGAPAWGEAILWVQLIGGTMMLLLVPFVIWGLARIGTTLAVSLLSTGESARMRAELDEQRLRRQLAVDAAEHERRRIERDLHDGAQQRLVALGMTLGLARQKLPADPDAAAELVEEAHAEAKLAHAELRDLARGIHPAILADRGLDAALSALLRRMPLPVSIIVAMPRRPPAAVESAAYFVVSEALTNVSRHAAATRATVSITEADGTVAVEITDDGMGGADPAGGTGLNGLVERVAGLNGRLTVDSPAGGPTVIRAEIPCAS